MRALLFFCSSCFEAPALPNRLLEADLSSAILAAGASRLSTTAPNVGEVAEGGGGREGGGRGGGEEADPRKKQDGAAGWGAEAGSGRKMMAAAGWGGCWYGCWKKKNGSEGLGREASKWPERIDRGSPEDDSPGGGEEVSSSSS